MKVNVVVCLVILLVKNSSSQIQLRMEARKEHQRQMAGYTVSSILYPSSGMRYSQFQNFLKKTCKPVWSLNYTHYRLHRDNVAERISKELEESLKTMPRTTSKESKPFKLPIKLNRKYAYFNAKDFFKKKSLLQIAKWLSKEVARVSPPLFKLKQFEKVSPKIHTRSGTPSRVGGFSESKVEKMLIRVCIWVGLDSNNRFPHRWKLSPWNCPVTLDFRISNFPSLFWYQETT